MGRLRFDLIPFLFDGAVDAADQAGMF